jgi:hypothetical protein
MGGKIGDHPDLEPDDARVCVAYAYVVTVFDTCDARSVREQGEHL